MGSRLGQHFLKDQRILGVIARAVPVREGSTIIEIGPGHGELTREILDRFVSHQIKKWRFIAIEKDRALASALRAEFRRLPRFELIEGDVRDELPRLLARRTAVKNISLIGNVPYYVTGQLFTMVGEAAAKPDIVVFTVQKEVAERLVAEAPSMNRLAAAVRFWGDPEVLLYVPRGAFRPEPKVDSAVVVIHKKLSFAKDSGRYEAMLHVLFRQPRKTILNNMNDAAKRKELAADSEAIKKALLRIEVDPGSRPSALSVEKILALSKKLLP